MWYDYFGDYMISDAINARRSIRKYTSELVDEEIIINGINAGIKAPSAHNRQPWKFKILTLEEKNKVAKLLYDKTKDIVGHTGPHTASIIEEVPHLIMIFIDNDIKENRDMDILSIGACIENMILYFTEYDLGTIWIGNTNLINDEIKELLGVSYETISCLGVGYKNQDPKMRPRKELNDVLI